MKSAMKVIGYVRVSTEEQSTTGVSLAAQKAKLRAYAALYDVELVEIIEDAGVSAKTLERPGITRALAMLCAGEAEGLLVAKLDRLSRSVADMDKLITGYFGEKAKCKAELLSVADQIDTRTAAGRLVLNVLMSVAQWEREAIGERTRDALGHKKSRREAYAPTPLGYTRAEGSNRLEVDPVGMATVAKIRALRAEGAGYKRIADTLTAQGAPTQRGGAWHPSTVKVILNNSLYSDATLTSEIPKMRLEGSRSV